MLKLLATNDRECYEYDNTRRPKKPQQNLGWSVTTIHLVQVAKAERLELNKLPMRNSS